jgi:hypothetical protein
MVVASYSVECVRSKESRSTLPILLYVRAGGPRLGRLRCANNSFAKHISRLAVRFVVHLLGQAAARWPDRLYGLGSIGSHDFTDNSFTIRWGSDI